MLLLCSCTCDPSRYKWSICSIYHDVLYANGQTVRSSTTANVYQSQPFGISSDDISIEFLEDGSVRFKPYDSGVIYGSYKLKHNGIQDTSFTVTFENGETIDDGHAVSFYGGAEVDFSFRGIDYRFSDRADDSSTRQELQMQTEWLIKLLRKTDDFYLTEGQVILENGGGRLVSNYLDSDVDLYAEGYPVTAVHLTNNNELVLLDSLREGECLFTKYYDSRMVIYYIDPLPSEEYPDPDLPREYTILDLVPELQYYVDNIENAKLKLTREHSPALPGAFNEHLYKDTAEDISFWLERLIEVKLYPTDVKQDNDEHILYTMEFTDKLDEANRVIIKYENGQVLCGGVWYDCLSFPNWYGGRPVYSFSCRNYSMKGGGFAGYFSIYGIEFMLDKKQDYEYPEDHYYLTLEGEVGVITVYDGTHFYYNGSYYIVTSEDDFEYAF